MNKLVAPSALAVAVGLALAAQALPVKAQVTQQTMERVAKYNLEKCYGIAAKGKNDCAEGAHSCAGQATVDRDNGSFVLLPKGDCSKIAGGNLKGE
ncbi:MAG: DUF2282 domain-containing protein [Rhodospirillales bacterium]|nr:DUF2282 domain-containing protein [Rhodospirillales bacterium]